jgi:acyl-CoA thioester hydrolase
MEPYKFKTLIPIRFADFDSLGHVNNAKYLTYLEIARIVYFEEVIAGRRVDWRKEGIILAKAVIDFKQPITGYKNYFVSIRCTRIGTKSFDLHYLIINEEEGKETVMAEGMTTMVCFDYTINSTIPMKPEWRNAIEEFEGKKF